MSLQDKITGLGNAIIGLNNTRADKDLSNLSATGEAKLGTNSANKDLSNLSAAGEARLGGNSYHPPILSCMWSDHIINDIQWLRGDTFSWQSGDVYVTAYNKLVEEYSTGTEETEDNITFKRSTNGFKIADSTQEQAILEKYNTDGIAWYYILDTVNKRFKLPRTKFGFEGLRGTVGGDIAESLPNITGAVWNIAAQNQTYATQGVSTEGAFQKSLKSEGTGYASTGATGLDGFRFDASASSSTYQDNAPVQEHATQMYLYFYVGEYAREAIEQTAGLNTELFNNKLDIELDNLPNTSKSLISGFGMPSNRYIDLELGATGTEYVPPANGYVSVELKANQNGYCAIYVHNSNVTGDYRATRSGNNGTSAAWVSCCIAVSKGETFTINYNYVQGFAHHRFVYAQGEQE